MEYYFTYKLIKVKLLRTKMFCKLIFDSEMMKYGALLNKVIL